MFRLPPSWRCSRSVVAVSCSNPTSVAPVATASAAERPFVSMVRAPCIRSPRRWRRNFATSIRKCERSSAVSGTGGGFKKFSAGEIDICDASRTIKDEEQKTCEANGIKYVELEIAFDGLSVVVNPENDWCDCLTVEQLKAIWQPESAVSKWSDLNPAWPDEKIELFGPGTDSGTFDYFTEAIVGTAKSSRADYTPSEDDNMLVTGVEGSKYALGYFGYAYYVENKDRLKLLGVDPGDGKCVQPSEETVRTNEYKPLSRPLFIYVNKTSLKRPEIARVRGVLPGPGRRRWCRTVGYVPLSDEVSAKSKKLFDEALAAAKGN